MRQLNNNHFDTNLGATSQVVSSASQPLSVTTIIKDEIMTKTDYKPNIHIMNFTQFTNYVDNGVDGHPDELNLGDWTMRDLHQIKDLNIIHDILRKNNQGWNPCSEFSDYNDFIEGVLGQSCIVGAEKYLKVNVIETTLKELHRQYYNPDMWSLGEKLDKWILLYQMGKKDKIGFSS